MLAKKNSKRDQHGNSFAARYDERNRRTAKYFNETSVEATGIIDIVLHAVIRIVAAGFLVWVVLKK